MADKSNTKRQEWKLFQLKREEKHSCEGQNHFNTLIQEDALSKCNLRQKKGSEDIICMDIRYYLCMEPMASISSALTSGTIIKICNMAEYKAMMFICICSVTTTSRLLFWCGWPHEYRGGKVLNVALNRCSDWCLAAQFTVQLAKDDQKGQGKRHHQSKTAKIITYISKITGNCLFMPWKNAGNGWTEICVRSWISKLNSDLFTPAANNLKIMIFVTEVYTPWVFSTLVETTRGPKHKCYCSNVYAN